MQRESTKVRCVASPEQQLSLIPERKIVSKPVSLDHVYLLKSHAKALEYACDLADVDPKAVCSLLRDAGCKYEKTKWSRILSGERSLPSRDIHKFDAVVNNDAYFLYLAREHQYDLPSMRKVGDDKDRRIADLEQALLDEQRLNARLLAAHRQVGK